MSLSRRTIALIVGLVVIFGIALGAGVGKQPPVAEEPVDTGTGTGGWLVIAAIAGAVFTGGGAILNDHLAGRREDRRAAREAEQQRQQWDREDRIRREDKEETDRLRIREQRAQAYKAFVGATTFPAPFEEERQGELIEQLNERYTDALIYCSNYLASDAERLYAAGREALLRPDASEGSEVRQQLKERQADFWDAARVEARRDYQHDTPRF